MDYRKQLIELIDKKIEELQIEINKKSNIENSNLLKSFYELKNNLRKIIYIPDEQIKMLSKLISNEHDNVYSILIYIKTIELGLAQGINFVYTDDEIKAIDKVFDSANNKISILEVEENKIRLNLQSYIIKQDYLKQLKIKLNKKDEFFSDISEIVNILRECNMSNEDIVNIVINLVNDNNNIYNYKLEYKKN